MGVAWTDIYFVGLNLQHVDPTCNTPQRRDVTSSAPSVLLSLECRHADKSQELQRRRIRPDPCAECVAQDPLHAATARLEPAPREGTGREVGGAPGAAEARPSASTHARPPGRRG